MLDAGAIWAESPHAVAAQCHVVVSMVGFPQDVETVYYGCDGVLAGTHAGDPIIDTTTSAPTLAKSIALKLQTKELMPLMRRFREATLALERHFDDHGRR